MAAKTLFQISDFFLERFRCFGNIAFDGGMEFEKKNAKYSPCILRPRWRGSR